MRHDGRARLLGMVCAGRAVVTGLPAVQAEGVRFTVTNQTIHRIDYFATHFYRSWGISAVFTEPTGIRDAVYLPTGQLTAFYSKHHGDRLVRVETSGVPTYEQPYRMGGIGSRKTVAAIDVLARARKTAVFVHAINRSFEKAMEVMIDLSGFRAGDGAVHRLVQGRLNDVPEEGQPEQIGHESTHELPGSAQPLKVTLPERSVSCIEIPLAS